MRYDTIRWHIQRHLENHPLRNADTKTRKQYLCVLKKIAEQLCKDRAYTDAVLNNYEKVFPPTYELTDTASFFAYRNIIRHRFSKERWISYRYILLFDCFLLCGVQTEEDCVNIILSIEYDVYKTPLSTLNLLCSIGLTQLERRDKSHYSPLQKRFYTVLAKTAWRIANYPVAQPFLLLTALHASEYCLSVIPEAAEYIPFWRAALEKLYSANDDHEASEAFT